MSEFTASEIKEALQAHSFGDGITSEAAEVISGVLTGKLNPFEQESEFSPEWERRMLSINAHLNVPGVDLEHIDDADGETVLTYVNPAAMDTTYAVTVVYDHGLEEISVQARQPTWGILVRRRQRPFMGIIP